MKRIVCILAAAMLSLGLLTACQSSDRQTYFEENSKGEIVDSALLEKIEQESEPLDTKIENYSCHSGRNLFLGPGIDVMFSDKFLYVYRFIGDQGYVKIDLQSGEVIPLCDVAGCTHDPNDFPDCINNRNIGWIIAVGDELWYSNHNKIFAMKDGKEEVIYVNNYCTKIEETQNPDNKYSIYYPIADDNYVYIFGFAYVVQIDSSTMTTVKTIDLPTECALRTPVVYKGSIYFCNETSEAFKTDIESGETTKLGDHINCIYVKNDTIYYTIWNDGAATLYKADLDLQNSEKLLDNCYSDFAIKDNKLFYHGCSQSGKQGEIMCLDLDTGESKTVYDGFSETDGIIAADFSDRLFFIGEYANPDDTSEQYDVIASVRSDGSDLWVKKFSGELFNN